MKTNVRDTSLEAYASTDFGRQAGMIFNYLNAFPNRTRREVADAMHLDVSSVAGRVNELVKLGAVLESNKRKCHITGKTAWTLSTTVKSEEQ